MGKGEGKIGEKFAFPRTVCIDSRQIFNGLSMNAAASRYRSQKKIKRIYWILTNLDNGTAPRRTFQFRDKDPPRISRYVRSARRNYDDCT